MKDDSKKHLRDDKKVSYKSAKDANEVIRRISMYGVLNSDTPLRAYKSELTGKWHITSRPRLGEGTEYETGEISSKEVAARIEKLQRKVKVRASTGKEYAHHLPNEVISGIVRDFITGGFTIKEIATKWDVAASTVGKYTEFYLKDYKQIKQINGND